MGSAPISPGNLSALVKDPRLKGVLAEIVRQANESVLGLASNHESLATTLESVQAALQASIDAIVTCPVGGEILWPLATPPANFLEEDGAPYSRTTYSTLYGVIGTDYGVGDGSTTFNVPDMRGQFIRIWDHGAGNDPDAAARTDRGDGTTGDNVGTKQSWAIQNITGALRANAYTGATPLVYASGAFKAGSYYNAAYSGGGGSTNSGAIYSFNASNVVQTSTETRPLNAYRMVCIRYK